MAARPILDRLTRSEFAHLGAGKLGYIRKMRSEDVSRVFPEAPNLNRPRSLGAVRRRWHADLLTDNRSSTFFKAAEDDLQTVSLH